MTEHRIAVKPGDLLPALDILAVATHKPTTNRKLTLRYVLVEIAAGQLTLTLHDGTNTIVSHCPTTDQQIETAFALEFKPLYTLFSSEPGSQPAVFIYDSEPEEKTRLKYNGVTTTLPGIAAAKWRASYRRNSGK